MDFYAAMGSAHALGLRAKNKLVRDFEAAKKGELSGQGLIEYVLIIAIISLVIVVAGPQVTKAIQTQFKHVADILNNGTQNSIVNGGFTNGAGA